MILLIVATWGCRGPASTPPAPPADKQCDTARDGWDCWVPVPGGRFSMGAQATDPNAPGYDPHAQPDEGPVHEVEVGARWMTRAEVSASAWIRCVEAGRCRPADKLPDVGPGPAEPEHSGAPAAGLTWQGAQAVCTWLGGRLATEAEWEHAARGADARRFPWGDGPRCPAADPTDPKGDRDPETGFCKRNGPTDAGALRHPSPFGLLGLAGNLWEWVADEYGPYGGAPDPRGLRVQRGGGFSAASIDDLRSAARASMPPDQRVHDVGARCVWTGP